MESNYHYELGDMVIFSGHVITKRTPILVVITQVTKWVDFNGVHRYYSISDGRGFTDTFIHNTALEPAGRTYDWTGFDNTQAQEVLKYSDAIRGLVSNDSSINPTTIVGPAPATTPDDYDSMPAYEYGEKDG